MADFCHSKFDGWDAAREIYSADEAAQDISRRVDYKTWVHSRYGMELDRESIRKMVSETKHRLLIHEELNRVRDGVITKARFGP